jgi:molybdate-binding protein/DNA-binding XRE family transcriptional regulator
MEAMEVQNSLALLRAKRGLGAAQLAATVGVSRQTIYAIEAGTYVPNTAVSLKLARALDVKVEEIFQIEPEVSAPDDVVDAVVLGDIDSMASGQPLRLCSVGNQVVAVAPEAGGLGLAPSDAILLTPIRGAMLHTNAQVRILGEEWKKPNRILISGCDPSVSILSQAMQKQGFELVIAYENSSRSLELLRDKLVHIAGTHLTDSAAGKKDLPSIAKFFGRNSVAVISYAIWQEGLVTAQGNPKKISTVADLARKEIRIANRETGAGCRRLLDELLRENGINSSKVKGYDRVIAGHLPAARLVRSGEVDCCVSTEAVGRALGLHFIPLVQKPYHLVIRRAQLNLTPIQALIETLGRASFRREVESCTGYVMRTAGDPIV